MVIRNDDNIQELIDSNSLVIVQFGASWCVPCKTLKPKTEKISHETPDVTFAYVDIEGGEQFSQKMKVQAVPTVIGFHNGNPVETLVGATETGVKELVEKLRACANS